VLVCDGHYYADGDEEKGGYGEGDEDAVPGEADGVVFDDEDADCEHEDEGEEIPMHGRVGVAAHETAVDVFGAGDHVFGAGLGQVCGLAGKIVV